MEGYIMKRKFILWSLILCMATSSVSTKPFDGGDNKTLLHYGLAAGGLILQHYLLDCPSMSSGAKLKYHAMYFMYKHLVGISTTACHELGHALSHTLLGNQVTDISVDLINTESVCTGFYRGETSTKANNLELLNQAIGAYVTQENTSAEERTLKLCSAIKKFHMKNIISIGMGPISGLVFTSAAYAAFIKFYGSKKDFLASDYHYFFISPLLANATLNTMNLFPLISSDGTQLSFFIRGLFAIYRLKNPLDTDELEEYINTYLPEQSSRHYKQLKNGKPRLSLQEMSDNYVRQQKSEEK